MTERTVSNAMRKIDAAKKQGFYLEAFLKAYHMNISLMKHILQTSTGWQPPEEKKIKPFLRGFFKAHKKDGELKAIISNQTIKTVRVWLNKTDIFFKMLKTRQPYNTRQLLEETTRVAGMLSISLSKINSKINRGTG